MHITFSQFNSKIFVELTIRLSDAKVTLLEVEEYFVRYMVQCAPHFVPISNVFID